MRDAAQHAVKAGYGINACPNLLMGREEVLAGFLITELRFVSKNRGKLAFKLVADVDHETRPDIVIERCVNDFEGPMGSGRSGLVAGLPEVRGLRSEV